MKRCSWVNCKSELYKKYHDTEWGIPLYDDKKLFELLILEGFQAGLSWLSVLNKREDFRNAFDNFDVNKIMEYTPQKVTALLNNDKIIRNKNKIISTINNAKIFKEIQKEFGSFSKYIWNFSDNKIVKHNGCCKIPTSSDLSDKISADLKKRGMKYVGTVIIYSYLQAIGIINDHEKECYLYNVDRTENAN
ncbi:MAG: DNA-3-methyladenine glycosylase I [bacterium]|nr:DNA-3-methyladenine glycosylase I [bacterium]